MANLPQQAAPFNDYPVDVAGTKQISDPGVLVHGILVDRDDYLFGTGTVLGRDTVFEIARHRLQAVFLVAHNS